MQQTIKVYQDTHKTIKVSPTVIIGGGGTLNHDELFNRPLPDQHPIEAITGLEAELEALDLGLSGLTLDLDTLSGYTQSEFNSVNQNIADLSGYTQSEFTSVNQNINDLSGYTYTNIVNLTNEVQDLNSGLTNLKIDTLYTPDGSTGFVYTDNGLNLHIEGNIIQSGASYETHVEQLYTKNDYIILRDGAVSGLPVGQYTGIQAKLYDGLSDGRLVFGSDGFARVGDVGDEQPLATRVETPTDGYYAVWDDTNKRLDFSDLDTTLDGYLLKDGNITATGATQFFHDVAGSVVGANLRASYTDGDGVKTSLVRSYLNKSNNTPVVRLMALKDGVSNNLYVDPEKSTFSKRVQYDSDFSATFTDNSLVNKKYVEDNFLVSEGNITSSGSTVFKHEGAPVFDPGVMVQGTVEATNVSSTGNKSAGVYVGVTVFSTSPTVDLQAVWDGTLNEFRLLTTHSVTRKRIDYSESAVPATWNDNTLITRGYLDTRLDEMGGGGVEAYSGLTYNVVDGGTIDTPGTTVIDFTGVDVYKVQVEGNTTDEIIFDFENPKIGKTMLMVVTNDGAGNETKPDFDDTNITVFGVYIHQRVNAISVVCIDDTGDGKYWVTIGQS